MHHGRSVSNLGLLPYIPLPPQFSCELSTRKSRKAAIGCFLQLWKSLNLDIARCLSLGLYIEACIKESALRGPCEKWGGEPVCRGRQIYRPFLACFQRPVCLDGSIDAATFTSCPPNDDGSAQGRSISRAIPTLYSNDACYIHAYAFRIRSRARAQASPISAVDADPPRSAVRKPPSNTWRTAASTFWASDARLSE